jgi:hypothetical protein
LNSRRRVNSDVRRLTHLGTPFLSQRVISESIHTSKEKHDDKETASGNCHNDHRL